MKSVMDKGRSYVKEEFANFKLLTFSQNLLKISHLRLMKFKISAIQTEKYLMCILQQMDALKVSKSQENRTGYIFYRGIFFPYHFGIW